MHPAFGSAMHYFAFMNFILSHLTHVDNVLLLYDLISQLDDDFPLLVQQYLKKEHLLEDWLDEQEGH